MGLTEPDGSKPVGLDSFNGHDSPSLGYHYHASTQYPYVNGGFHGEVVKRGGQVDPQPRARSIRRDQPPLRGAEITEFVASSNHMSFSLSYTVNGRPAKVAYSTADHLTWNFEFTGMDGAKREETFRVDERRPGGPSPREGVNRPRRESGPNPLEEMGRPGAKGMDGAIFSDPFATAGLPSFSLKSSLVVDGGNLPIEFTGDGSASTLPIEWSGAPVGTESYVLVMHHLDPEGKTKWYWTLYNIPATTRNLPKNVQGVGTLGNNSVNGRVGYAPPHSKGPGTKVYVLTLYALSSELKLEGPSEKISYPILLSAMTGKVLATANLRMIYTRNAGPSGELGMPR